MFGSRRPSHPHAPQKPPPDPDPDPTDRYAPTSAVRLNLVDIDGVPVVVYLSRHGARQMIRDIYRVLARPLAEGGEL